MAESPSNTTSPAVRSASPEEDGVSEATNSTNRINSPHDLMRKQMDKLFSNPDKPVHIPKPPKEKGVRPPREIMKNVQGSSAGAGSGEFHVYKQSRRREYERLRQMEEKEEKEKKQKEYEEWKQQAEAATEEKTAKNRAKRLKKREKRKGGGGGGNSGNSEQQKQMKQEEQGSKQNIPRSDIANEILDSQQDSDDEQQGASKKVKLNPQVNTLNSNATELKDNEDEPKDSVPLVTGGGITIVDSD